MTLETQVHTSSFRKLLHQGCAVSIVVVVVVVGCGLSRIASIADSWRSGASGVSDHVHPACDLRRHAPQPSSSADGATEPDGDTERLDRWTARRGGTN